MQQPNTQAWDVSIAACDTYDPQAVREALLAALAPIGGLSWVRPGMKIAVKANLMMRVKPDRAATVHPEIAAQLCRLLVEKGASVVLGDSPGGPFTPVYLASVYAATGMHAVEQAGAALNTDVSYIDVDCPEAIEAKQFQITGYLAQADAIIDLCKLKTHGLMAYTGACKNMFGAVPGMRKSEYHYQYKTHERFANMLVDICEWCKPRLCVMDAVVAMQGNGPSGGTPRRVGAILVAFHPHALDLAASHLVNLTIDDIPTLRAAHERGLIPKSVSDIPIHGDLSAFVVPDFQLTPKHDVQLWGTTNKFAAGILRRSFASRPKIDRKACTGCAECVRVCPAHCITLTNKRARIDREACVRCFCCQEFCPSGVIRVYRPLGARLADTRRGGK